MGQKHSSGFPRTKRRRKNQGPDFSTLPEVVWVEVMQMLSVADRYHLALTCTTLRALLHHPSVWRRESFDLATPNKGATFVRTVDKFGKYLKYCEISFVRPPSKDMAENWLEGLALERIENLVESDSCSLKNVLVRLDCRSCASSYLELVTHFANTIDSLAGRRLVDVMLYVWPEDLCPILDIVARCEEEREEGTESGADVFCRAVYELVLTDTLPSQETPPQVATDVMSRFHCLQKLSVHATAVSDNLLYELASTAKRRSQLKEMTIQLEASLLNDAISKRPETLSSEAWKALAGACPALKVTVFCSWLRLPDDYGFRSLIRPETPLYCFMAKVHVQYLPSSQCAQMLTEHADTLRQLRFASYGTGGRGSIPGKLGNLPLIALLKVCHKVQELVYNERIYYKDVMAIAQLNRQWRRLEFYQGHILTDNGQLRLTRRHAVTGQLIQTRRTPAGGQRTTFSGTATGRPKAFGQQTQPNVGRQPFPSDEELLRSRRLQELCDFVSQHVGFPWRPNECVRPFQISSMLFFM